MKALVVDDSLVARSVIKKVLKSVYPEAEITEAINATDATEKLEVADFDIFTVDFNMPGGTGDTVIEQAQKKCPEAKICLLTANKQQVMQDKCAQWGVTFVEKPHFQEPLEAFLRA